MLTKVIAESRPISFEDNLEESKHLIRPFFDSQVKLFLLMVATIPLDVIVQSVFRLPLISYLYSFWTAFAVFIFVKSNHRGLDIFWISRSTINHGWLKNLIRIIGAACLAALPALCILFPAILGGLFAPYWLRVVLFALIMALLIIYFYFVKLFMTAFTYELYSALPHPKTYWKPKTSHLLLSIAVLWIITGLLYVMFPKQGDREVKEYIQRGRQHRSDMYRR